MKTFIMIFLVAFTPLSEPANLPEVGVNWLSNYREARQQSKGRGMPILINVSGPNCIYCKKMDTTTLTDPETISIMKSYFITLKLDAGRNRELVTGLGVRLLPTFIIADPDGKVLSSIEGYSASQSFISFMRDALETMPNVLESSKILAEAMRATGLGEIDKAKSLLKIIIDKEPQSLSGKKASNLLSELNMHKQNESEILSSANESKKTLNAPGALASRSTNTEEKSSLTVELLSRMISDRKSGKMASAHEIAEQIKAIAPGTNAEADAQRVIDDILADSQAMKQLVDVQSDRLAGLLFQAAEAALKQGQPQQAIYYLDRVSLVFPNSRLSSMAQIRLAQIQGPPPTKLPLQPIP